MRLSPTIPFFSSSALLLAIFAGTALAQQPSSAPAADYWTAPAGELAARIVARAAPLTSLVLTVRNISSLGDDDVGRIRRDLRSELRKHKIRLTTNQRGAAEVLVTLSENVEGLTWVAEIQSGETREVAMVTVARPAAALHSPVEPLAVRKTRVYAQADPMLDVVPLAGSFGEALGPDAPVATPARILVLGIGAVSLYEKAAPVDKASQASLDGAAWQQKTSMPFSRLRPWPRDARGRLVIRTDNQFDVYLPGGKCSGTVEPPAVECQEIDEPWPLGAAGPPSSISPNGPSGPSGLAAYFNPERSFFDGRIRLDDGREIKTPPFFAAAVQVGRAGVRPGGPTSADLKVGATTAARSGATSSAVWLVSGLDDRVQLLNGDGVSIANIGGLGSVLVGLQTGCRSGWQILATQPGDFNEPDAVQAYDLVNHKAVEASLPITFAGPVTEMWPLSNGSEALAISRNLKTAEYEAFRLSISCGQ